MQLNMYLKIPLSYDHCNIYAARIKRTFLIHMCFRNDDTTSVDTRTQNNTDPAYFL